MSEDELIQWCLDCMRGVLPDGTKTDVADRRWAVNWLGERGWGKPTQALVADDEEERDDAAIEAAVEHFRSEVTRLSTLRTADGNGDGSTSD